MAGSRKRVLVVDDDESIRRMLSRVLSPIYDVVLAANGAQALDEIRRWRPDLVLLDLRMPVMDGWQLLDHLEAEGLEVPVVVASAETHRCWPDSPLVRARHEKLAGLPALLAACATALAGLPDDEPPGHNG